MRSYDLPTLLKLGDLDIRGFAANNETISVAEYFNTLEKFLDDAPKVTDDLNKIIKHTAEEQNFTSLADMRELLSGIGCEELVPVFDKILDAGKKGNRCVAAIYAEKISIDFFNLCRRTKTAEKPHKIRTSAIAGTGVLNGKNDKISLKAFTEQLDYAEANRKLRILAVDDAAFMLSTIRSILKNDYEVFSLAKGALVEKFLQHTTPELFLLDYTMPEINGFELVPIIRDFAEHKNTPIMFLTAMGTSHHVAKAVSLGACDYVVKPVNAEILREKVARHIVRKKSF